MISRLLSRRGNTITSALMATGIAGVVALMVTSVSKQAINTQKAVQIHMSENNLVKSISSALHSATACKNTLSRSVVTPGGSLTAIYKADNTALVSTGDIWENMVKIESLSLSFDPANMDSLTGGSKRGPIDLVIGLKRVSKSFEGISQVRRTVSLSATIDASNNIVECRNSLSQAKVETALSEARRESCEDIGGSYNEQAAIACNRNPSSTPPPRQLHALEPALQARASTPPPVHAGATALAPRASSKTPVPVRARAAPADRDTRS